MFSFPSPKKGYSGLWFRGYLWHIRSETYSYQFPLILGSFPHYLPITHLLQLHPNCKTCSWLLWAMKTRVLEWRKGNAKRKESDKIRKKNYLTTYVYVSICVCTKIEIHMYSCIIYACMYFNDITGAQEFHC